MSLAIPRENYLPHLPFLIHQTGEMAASILPHNPPKSGGFVSHQPNPLGPTTFFLPHAHSLGTPLKIDNVRAGKLLPFSGIL